MINTEVKNQYKTTIGIECHVQLKTKTKLFAAVGNDAREAPPNTLVSHICFGLPGALPVLNKEAIHLASRAAFALNSTPQKFSKFDRKHYFYPDLPKGYQITQYDEPIVIGGYIDITVLAESGRSDSSGVQGAVEQRTEPYTKYGEGAAEAATPQSTESASSTAGSTGRQASAIRTIRIGITRAHLEEDAGKSTHPMGKDYSLIDLNRAGTPLLEIVSEPDMHSSAEAKAYAHELYLRMKYADVSEANLYYGNMRFDVNVSVSKTDEMGVRSETKNLNSFRSVEKAVDYEVQRQIELLEKGGKVVQETRGWDDAKQATFSQRTKEDAHDYRYMPDPDIPPVVLDDKYIVGIKSEMPDLPDDYRRILSEIGIESSVIADIVAVPGTAMTVKRVYEAAGASHARRVAFWLLQPQDEDDAAEVTTGVSATDEQLIQLSHMIEDNKLSSTAAKRVLAEVLRSGKDPEVVAADKNLLQVSDEGEIAKIVEQVLSENTKAAEDVRNGEAKAIGFLVGQVMKQSQGKANPALAQKLIKKQLGL